MTINHFHIVQLALNIYDPEAPAEETQALACVARNRVMEGIEDWFAGRPELANPKFLATLQIAEDAFYGRMADLTEGATEASSEAPAGSHTRIGTKYFK